MALWKKVSQPRGEEYATTLVGNVIRIPRWSSFADAIDPSGLEAVTRSITGLGKHEVAGSISRPRDGFRWEPHPVFARVGVPAIQADANELGMILLPSPSATADERAYTIFLKAHDKNDIDMDTELNFLLKRLRFPDSG
ncbi:MAG TPA: hypothetical protein VHF06_00780 [Pseudonocardiaceae bacterium]|jgi:hypothetical protein|nr:hypothetical protein [Pseudonocardiaceae bacterium]